MAEKKFSEDRNTGSEITLDLTEDILGKLPDDFDLDEIGRIDLREAESIASEGALFLTEDDLLKELENFDVIPLREESHDRDTEEITGVPSQDKEAPRKVDAKAGSGETPPAGDLSIDIVSSEDAAGTERAEAIETERHGPDGGAVAPQETPERKAGITGREDEIWINLSGEDVSVISKEEPEKAEAPDDIAFLHEEDLVPAQEDESAAETEVTDGQVMDEEFIDETDMSFTDQAVRDAVFEDDTDLDEYDELVADLEEPEPEDDYDDGFTILIDEIEEEVPEEVFVSDYDENEPVEYEVIPEDIGAVEPGMDNVIFVDDSRVDKQQEGRGTLLEEAELERLTTDLAVVDEGRSVLLDEADYDEDRERIADIVDEYTMTYDDLWLDFDEDITYQDDELDFVHSSIIEEDYSRYMREIDEYYKPRGESGEGRALEVLGLTVSDMDSIEDQLYADEYRDVELEDIFDIFYREPGSRDRDRMGEKDCTYILPRKESLLEEEKDSIEQDMTSNSALIFEEDVEDIRANLMEMAGREKAMSVEVIDEVHDITDSVVIIEDDVDVDRFVQGFPQEKQHDMKKLLKYFDGLFEKLPEKTIRNFANSEYFELYTKVMHDLDGYGTS